MTKFWFDQHVTLDTAQPLTVLLFDLCSPGQELLFVQDDSGGLLVGTIPVSAARLSHFVQSLVLLHWTMAISRIMTSSVPT